jgi:hypothetical protein
VVGAGRVVRTSLLHDDATGAAPRHARGAVSASATWLALGGVALVAAVAVAVLWAAWRP